MADVDKILQSLESELARDKEIDRILACHLGDYFAILQINPLHGLDELSLNLRRAFRRKSLLIHPDKTNNDRAPTAFALLKKAERVLSAETSVSDDSSPDSGLADAAEKRTLIEMYKQVHERLRLSVPLDFDHPDNVRIREDLRLYLVSHWQNQEIDKNYAQRQEQQKQEALKTMAKERELKRSWEKRWEQDRGDRVRLWRNFTSKVEKPKKKKKNLLA